MKLPRQPFVGLAIAAMVGIVVADVFPVPRPFWFEALIVFSVLALTAFCWSNLSLTYLAVAGAFFLVHDFQVSDTPGLRLAALLKERPRAIEATGFVASEPKTASGSASFLLKLKSIRFEGIIVPSDATILVRWPGAPELGDELKLFGMIEPVSPPRNPGEFDMRSYLARHDVYRYLFVHYAEEGTLIRHGGGNWILRAAQKSRAWLRDAICRGLNDSPDVQNFLSGLALGLRHQTPEDIEEPFQQTGTLHLFAVAGLHVGIVARLLWILAMVARLPQRWATALIIPLLFFYATVTGLHVSSVRAAVMASVLLGGYFFERKAFSLNSLAAAAFLLLCWDTNELFSTGFQLSFAVVGGIVLFADPLFLSLQKLSAPDPFLPRSLLSHPRRAAGAVFESIFRGGSVSMAAWIGSLVLIFWYFNLVTPVSLIANLVVVPIAFVILGIALLSILIAPLITTLSVTFNNANWFLARAVLIFVHWFAQIPSGHYYIEHLQWTGQTRAKVTVLDAGTGGAAHLRTGGRDWLLDCASERDYERLLRPYLHVRGVNHIDGLILSHGDALHIGGAGSLLRDFVPRMIIDNPSPDRSIVHRRLRQMFRDAQILPAILETGKTFQLSPNVTAKVFFPPKDFAGRTADDEVGVIQIAIRDGPRILFTFDSGSETEQALLNSKCDLRSDILAKGQHHSSESGSVAFLDSVQPQLIIATSRDFPQSERITDDWAERVRSRGIKLFRQDEAGAVELLFDGDHWSARAYLTGETFRSDNR